MSKMFGRAFIRVNGLTLASLPGTGKLDPGGVERTPVVGDYGFLGYTEKPVHAEIECDIIVDANTDIVALNRTADASVTFECDSGQVFIVRNASLAMPVKPQSGDGKASVKFIGSAAEQA
ncbi:Phage tail tube protein [Noviherbaspirillum humi]|uniref:Phage tail tube protein n=1 Tax=Noviherbaspirillum humi TaxID=1688639 RepID=A0A239LF56_9BURK|nr:phage tail tube protein [Noviherbaspirillum humi]SNT28975.1 Phage tail tube protein [Noviherbaspirillum humi]